MTVAFIVQGSHLYLYIQSHVAPFQQGIYIQVHIVIVHILEPLVNWLIDK